MELESIMLSKICHTQKIKGGMLSVLCGSWKGKEGRGAGEGEGLETEGRTAQQRKRPLGKQKGNY